jgi:hypothetical protein
MCVVVRQDQRLPACLDAKHDLASSLQLKIAGLVKYRRNEHRIAKGCSIALVIEDFDKDWLVTLNRAAYCFTQPWLSGWTSQKFAVPANDFIFGVSR